MKKLLSIITVLTLVLVLSGCANDVKNECLNNGGSWGLNTCTYTETYYTQEEVDEMLEAEHELVGEGFEAVVEDYYRLLQQIQDLEERIEELESAE